MRRTGRRNLVSVSPAEALHTPSANTDRGRLHQGVEKIRRRTETEIDIRRAIETKGETEIETEIEIETDTEKGKGKTDEVTRIEGKTEIEVETTTAAETRRTERGKIVTARETGAPKKGNGIKTVKERRGRIQLKTNEKRNIRKKRRSKGKNLKGKRC